MIKVMEEDLQENHAAYLQAYTTSSSATFLEDGFITKSFPKLEKMYNRTYPYDVKIPKSIVKLREGDFSPSKLIRITEPIKGSFSNIWFGDAADGVFLRCGYRDGDSRYICNQKLDDSEIHMVLGGSTGQGKSVTLNALIYGLCLEYAPWEITLTLCDAKIVEFKSYALQTPMPHIKNIAATGDADYLISVLQNLDKEMMLLNSAFTKAGVKNIKDFRKQTGLCLPQNIIVMDEFQTMFKFAGKKASLIEKILDDFARLGRNTGYHLLLASQEIGSEISQQTLGNIKVRAAVGCTSTVSEKILGNDAAKNNFGKKGHLLFNTNSEGHRKEDNVLIRVPYMPDNQRIALGQELIEKGKIYNYANDLSFYDEEEQVDESNYLDFLKKWTLDNNSIILGEPSFVMEGTEKLVRLHFDRKEMENICILAIGNNNMRRYFQMLRKNIELHTNKAVNLVVAADAVFVDECDAASLATTSFFTESKVFENNILDIAFKMINRRKLMLEVDKIIFESSIQYRSEFDEFFYERFDKGGKYDTDLNKKRFLVADNLLKTDPEFNSRFGVSNYNGGELSLYTFNQSKIAVETFATYNSIDTRLTIDSIPPIYTWVLGMNKIIGLGRDTKNKYVQILKKALQDCTDVNIRFIMFTTTMEDIEDIRSGVRWFLIDGVKSQEINRIKMSDDYPDQVSGISCVLCDTLAAEGKCVKFKKMILDGEIIT